MNTLVIVIAVALIALYIGAKVLVVAFEVIKAFKDGADVVIKKSPSYALKILGRRNKGARLAIDDANISTANSNAILRKNEINQLNSYDPKINQSDQNFETVIYQRKISEISQRKLILESKKNVKDLDSILLPNKFKIKSKIESLVNKVEFPIPYPTFSSQIKLPPKITAYPKINIEEPSIKLPLWDGKLSKLNPYVYKEFSHEIALVENAKNKLQNLKENEPILEQKINEAHSLAMARYEKAVVEENNEQKRIVRKWGQAREAWEIECENEQNNLKSLVAAFKSGDIEKQAKLILDSIELPRWMPCNYELKYDKEAKILIVEHEFTDIGSIEWVKTVMLKSGATNKPLNQKELKYATDLLYPSVTLRLAYELATQLEGDVEAIAVNGWADYTVKSSGNTKRAYCSSLLATVDDIKDLNLSKLDPLAAFSNLNGNVARALELTPIAPKIKINTNDARYVEDKEVLGGLKSEQNLASMDWQDFEHLCRELFERLFASSGAVVKVTQASRDMGVDAVVHNADPILGGKIVIQAKRYVNTVDVSAVRDLWGTVNHEGAMKGILVTTSQYGPDSYAFIQNKPLQLINGNELLGLLEQYGYKFRINLEEARQFLKENNLSAFNNKDSI